VHGRPREQVDQRRCLFSATAARLHSSPATAERVARGERRRPGRVLPANEKRPPTGRRAMTSTGRLQMVLAYAVFAFVGAIVLGMF
jgi:hypothetical protein